MNSAALRQWISADPQAAKIALEKLCADHPSAEHYLLYAHCLAKLKQHDQAKTAYLKALEYDATCFAAHFGLAQILQATADFTSALTHLNACLVTFPHEVCFLFQKGFCQLQLNQLTEAGQTLNQVLSHAPHHLEALVNLGSCFMYQKDFAQAIHYFATACRIDENHLPAHYNLACALMEAKRFPQARDQFERYLEKTQDDEEAYYHFGFVQLMLDEYSQASQCFHKILEKNPDNILVMHNLASIALKQKEPSVALGYYQRILALAASDEIALYMHAALAQKNTPSKAPNAYVKALFDQYAERFDQHLTQELNYQTPELLYQFWLQQKDAAKNVDHVLDLGCGTGLMGALVKTHANQLIGVDLSSEMLKIAEKKALYHALYEKEIIDYLNSQDAVYDLVILADVLVYFGDCEALFSKLASCARSILFSFEHSKAKDYALSVHGRYQHSLDYFCQLCKAFGFRYKIKSNVTLRTQNNEAVLGHLIWAEQ